jgi:hypothetical protein
MKSITFLLFVFLLSACATSSNATVDPAIEPSHQTFQRSNLPDLGKAPELTNEIWINTSENLRLEDLKGQVVLLEMWTFG